MDKRDLNTAVDLIGQKSPWQRGTTVVLSNKSKKLPAGKDL